MTLLEAIATIEHYQSWRLGADTEMIHPKTLTNALNIVLDEAKKSFLINAVDILIDDAKKGVLSSELNTDENINQILP